MVWYNYIDVIAPKFLGGLNMFKKFLNVACAFTLFCSFTSVSLAVTDEQMSYIEKFSKKINVPAEYFLFDVESNTGEGTLPQITKCALVPVQNIDDHKNCMKAIFGKKANKEYMKYYHDGRLSHDNAVEKKVKQEALEMQHDNPKSFTFVITYGDKSVGKEYVISMRSGRARAPMLGYLIKKEYSGKGITKASAKCLLNIMQCMVNNKDKKYSFTKLRATVAPANKASNAILSKLGFKKSAKTINNKYGKRNEYTYMFELKGKNENKGRKMTA